MNGIIERLTEAASGYLKYGGETPAWIVGNARTIRALLDGIKADTVAHGWGDGDVDPKRIVLLGHEFAFDIEPTTAPWALYIMGPDPDDKDSWRKPPPDEDEE